MVNLARRARRRFLRNELVSQGAGAACAALITFNLLLILGTQVLDWRWILLIAGLASGAGLYRVRRRLPSPYTAAQAVDHHLGLADTISTAFYFGEEPAASRVSPDLRAVQMEQAGRIAESVDVRAAVPFRWPRMMYAVGLLLLIAGSLMALRYGLTSRLDLKPTLASLLPFELPWHPRTQVALRNTPRQPQLPDPQDENGATIANPDQDPAGDPDPTANDNTDGTGDPGTEKSADSKGAAKPGEKNGQAGADQEAQAEQPGDPQSTEGSGQQGNNKQESKQASAGKPEQANAGESSSLMNKVKDLFQNLLSSVKPPQTNPSNQQQNSDSKNQQGKGQQSAGKQDQGKNGQQQNNGNPGDSEQGQPGEQAQSPQDPQSNGNGKSDSQQASKQPGSGIGNQNGDKTIKQAADLAAMGKITELFGKRSANITGEATVEVQSTSQQLRTPYAPQSAEHTQNGGEISRDEVPVAIQPYVEQYFEQVRKQAPATAPVPPKKRK